LLHISICIMYYS